MRGTAMLREPALKELENASLNLNIAYFLVWKSPRKTSKGYTGIQKPNWGLYILNKIKRAYRKNINMKA